MARQRTHTPSVACKGLKSASRKKLAKTERQQRDATNKALIAKANADKDLLAGTEVVRDIGEKFDVHFEAVAGAQLQASEVEACLSLLSASPALAEAAGWKQEEAERRSALAAPDTHVLLLRKRPLPDEPPALSDAEAEGWVVIHHPVEPKDLGRLAPLAPPPQPFTQAAGLGGGREAARGEIVGFLQLRFCIQSDRPVLHLQELELAEPVRASGLGEHAMQTAEELARKHCMSGLVLTCLKSNPALSFYCDKCRYSVDETSRSAAKEYVTLSKGVPA